MVPLEAAGMATIFLASVTKKFLSFTYEEKVLQFSSTLPSAFEPFQRSLLWFGLYRAAGKLPHNQWVLGGGASEIGEQRLDRGPYSRSLSP